MATANNNVPVNVVDVEFENEDHRALKVVRKRALFWTLAYLMLLFVPVVLYFKFYVPRWY